MSEPWDIAGKTVVLTGGTTGIGKATVEELARRGARVIFTSRKQAEGDAVVAGVAADVRDNVSHRELHLDDLASVRSFAADLANDLNQIDVLVNNAGVTLTERRVTTDGFEYTFGVNHLGHFLLVEEVRGLLESAAMARVVVVASEAHRMGGALDFDNLQAEGVRFGTVGGLKVYGRSKLANMLHVRQLATTFDPNKVTVNSLHPGAVSTRLGRDSEATKLGERLMWPLMSKFALTPEKGALTSLYAICSDDLTTITSQYLSKQRLAKPNKTALDDNAAVRLWDISMELVS